MSVQLVRSIDGDLLATVSEALRKKRISHYVTPKTPKTYGAVWLREECDMPVAIRVAEAAVAERDRYIRSIYPKKKKRETPAAAFRANRPMAAFAIGMVIVLGLWYFYFLLGYAT